MNRIAGGANERPDNGQAARWENASVAPSSRRTPTPRSCLCMHECPRERTTAPPTARDGGRGGARAVSGEPIERGRRLNRTYPLDPAPQSASGPACVGVQRIARTPARLVIANAAAVAASCPPPGTRLHAYGRGKWSLHGGGSDWVGAGRAELGGPVYGGRSGVRGLAFLENANDMCVGYLRITILSSWSGGVGGGGGGERRHRRRQH